MLKSDDYRFLHIKDAIACLNQRVNLIGVIVECGIPKRTKGTDCFCFLKIIDESYQSPGIAVNIFAENMDNLPHVSAGDIILLSHVLMKNHFGEVYALFNKKFSSFALFEGKKHGGLNPYQVSAKFHHRDQDKKSVTEMREWFAVFQLGTGSQKCSLLREIKEKEQFDLVCKVLHKCQIENNEWMLFIWDGTDAPPVSINEKVDDEAENPLPLLLERVPLPREIYCTFPGVGTVLRLTIIQEDEKMDVNMVDIGKWVKFRDVKCETRAGIWHGLLLPCSKILYLHNEDPLILLRQRSFNERISAKWDRMPQSAFPWPSCITETDHRLVSFVTLMDILTCGKVTAKFRCVVRVVAAHPWCVEDFRSSSGVYRMRLTLEDPTARIHAYVYAEDGEKFYEGFPAIEVLRRKRDKLLGIISEGDGGRNPAWVDFCIKSYYLLKTDPWGSRHYRVFDTKWLVMGSLTPEIQGMDTFLS